MIVLVQAALMACLSLISYANQIDQSQLLSVATVSLADSSELSRSERATLDIIEKSLLLYDKVFDIFRHSNRVAGQISQNAHMFTSWLLFTGLQMILNTKQTTSNKRQQGYSFLCIPLAKHALKLMSFLLNDLHLEFGDQTNNILEEQLDDVDDSNDHKNIQELNFFKKFSFNVQPCPSTMGSVTTTPATTPAELSPSSSRTSIPTSATMNTISSGNVRTMNATFKYNKFGHYSAWQRIDMIVSSNLNVIHLLFSYLSAGYRRATLLRHSRSKLTLDSNTSSINEQDQQVQEDEFTSIARKFIEQHQQNNHSSSMKDDDEVFEDDVHMQHSFLFETFNEQFNADNNENKVDTSKQTDVKTMLERDIDSHYELVISILDHLNYYFICSKIDALRSYFKQMLTDAQLIVLAHVIQDLDSEMDNVQTLSPLSSRTFYRFSNSLTSLMHNLIAVQILPDEQQNSLLAYLGFKPSLESECSWPLHHGVRSLAILAQIILLRQQKEQEDIKCDFNSTTIQIWRGFINKLKQSALSFKGEVAIFNPECPDFQEDLNVEHAQLMLFLFHNLKLLQRKHVFSLVGLALNEISVKLSANKCSISAAQILYIGRILHLFEYMCKNLYDTPAYLFEQINHNLLNLIINNNDNMDAIRAMPPKSKEALIKVKLENLQKSPDSFRNIKFFVDKKLELNYFSHLISSYRNTSTSSSSLKTTVDHLNNLNVFDFIIHPRFYHLMDVTITAPKCSSLRNFKPKLDGIACNFMLAGFQSLSYGQFYNSLLDLLQFLGYQYDFDSRQNHQCDNHQDEDRTMLRYPQFGSFGLCAMDYTFGTMWRLINQLPPSLQFLNDIHSVVNSSVENEFYSFVSIDASRILNMCIWLPRFENNRPVCQWVSELLSKQCDSNSNTIETIIKDMVRKFGSLQFNYQLLKCIGWSFFRYTPSTSNDVLSSKNILLTQQQQLLPLQSYQFPKFFTLFTMDIYLERLIFLFNEEFKKLSKNRNEDDPQMIVEKYLALMLGLFDKIHQEVNAVLLYDGPLSQAGRNNSADMQYLFYRSMVNICSSNSFNSQLSEIAANIIDYLPQSIVSKIDQWDRIHVNSDRNITDQELPALLQKGVLFDIPLIELASQSTTTTTATSSQSKCKTNHLYHLSAFINEKYAIDMPTVTSVDTGDGNITWIKLKQFMVKLFKFIEYVYSKKECPQRSDSFVTCLMLQLNLVSSTFVSKSSSIDHQSSLTYQILHKLFSNQDFTKTDIEPDSYNLVLYPHFIGNAFFILSVFNHPLFSELKPMDQSKIVKIFQSCSPEFFRLFGKILKHSSAGVAAFEELLGNSSPSTPTVLTQPQQPLISEINYSLLDLIKVTEHPLITSNYAVNVMKLIKTLYSQSEKSTDDVGLIRLCMGLSNEILDYNDRIQLLTNWFRLVLFKRMNTDGDSERLETIKSNDDHQSYYIDDSCNANLYMFFKFICNIIKGPGRMDEMVLVSVAEATIQNVQTLLNDTCITYSNNTFLYFSGLFTSLVYLISATGNLEQEYIPGKPIHGHFRLIHEVMKWLTMIKDHLCNREMLNKIETSLIGNGKQRFLLESSYQMLAYISDIFNALEYKYVLLKNRKDGSGGEEDIKQKKDDGKIKSSISNRLFIDDDFDVDVENTTIIDTDDEMDLDYEDDEELAGKLCTFTHTAKDFINQHWYHCHTCKMLDGVGVCTVCAKVCHRNHDITYSKYGSFFCDCGAKEDSSCKALVKRQPNASDRDKKLLKT
ncbi:hypothetical protein HUG17_7940 [Dermatophagoides farinae]|uniref:UBR-type domain-containing protein n=1 Tax=Dermatophagoides farinae TaxID=6954 RepID=A0A9D4NY84_DERFA|nr:hypothetical protein HUG17_7940 [Dermatophagoides farinae]